MNKAKLILWSPRILAVLVCLFLSAFALDAFENGKSFVQALPDFVIHLAPAVVLLAIVALAWRWEWVGAVAFTGLAAAYAYVARTHVSWIPVIGGPLLIVGVLYSVSWFSHGWRR
jgi:glucose-6-phosphate-specific signal transduction histidine kinase